MKNAFLGHLLKMFAKFTTPFKAWKNSPQPLLGHKITNYPGRIKKSNPPKFFHSPPVLNGHFLITLTCCYKSLHLGDQEHWTFNNCNALLWVAWCSCCAGWTLGPQLSVVWSQCKSCDIADIADLIVSAAFNFLPQPKCHSRLWVAKQGAARTPQILPCTHTPY